MHTNLHPFRPQDKNEFQSENDLLHVDPFWELVCTEVIHFMGPAAQHIRHCKPEKISPKDKVVDLNCDTQEAALFVQQFDFIILGTLKPYFPALKRVRVYAK